MGMFVWGVQESLSMRVLMLDSGVNLAGMAAASIAAGWTLPAGEGYEGYQGTSTWTTMGGFPDAPRQDLLPRNPG